MKYTVGHLVVGVLIFAALVLTATSCPSVGPGMVVTITASPPGDKLAVSAIFTFEATVTGCTVCTVTWSATAGSIDGTTGTYTAPASVIPGGTATITATSTEDPTKSDSQVITILGPASGEIRVTDTDGNPIVAWHVSGQPVNQAADFPLKIWNVGETPLTILGLSGLAAPFSLVNPPATPLAIAAGEAQALTLRFAPAGEGSFSDTLIITNSDADENPTTLALEGTTSGFCRDTRVIGCGRGKRP
ncbi:MAG: hypothetical protein HY335_07700 [Deinococcus sp.]|nr:hypothetical protein [Deinococcus sp.]